MYIFSEQICMFGYLKTPDIMLSIVSSKKLDWTHTFDTHCMFNCPQQLQNQSDLKGAHTMGLLQHIITKLPVHPVRLKELVGH